MNLPTRLLFFIFILGANALAQGCKTPHRTAVATAKAPPKATEKAPLVTSVQMSRGYCFGKCPVYDIRIENSGLVRYSGKRFVEKEGVYEKTFNKATVDSLLKDFTKARIDTMQNSYESLVSDLPSIQYTIMFSNGQRKAIENAHFGPQILARLAREVDELVKSPDYSWKRTAVKVEE